MILVWCILGVVLIGTLGHYVSKKSLENLQRKVPSFSFVSSLRESFTNEIESYQNEANIAGQMEAKVTNLKLPIPDPPNPAATSETIFKRLIATFENNSQVFAGAEQIALQMLSSDSLYHSLAQIIKTMGTQLGQTALDAWSQIQQIGPDALHSASVDTYGELAATTLKSIISGLKEYYTDSNHFLESTGFLLHLAHGVAEHDPGDLQDILQHLFDHEHMEVYRHGGESIVNSIHEHMDSISHSVSEHSHNVSGMMGEEIHEGLSDPGDGIHAHFPFITLIMSSLRETALLLEEKTSFANSIKNISLDVAGTGLGALGGAKAGFAIGMLFGPVGAAIGGVAGAISGAIAGRTITNRIKTEPLRESIEAYQNRLAEMKLALKEAAVSANNEVRNTALESQNDLLDKIGEMPKLIDIREFLLPISMRLKASILVDIRDARMQINQINRRLSARKQLIKDLIERAERDISIIEAGIPDDETVMENPAETLFEFLSNPALVNGRLLAEAKKTLCDLHATNVNYVASYLFWSYHAGLRYREAVNEILETFEGATIKYYATSKEWMERIQVAQDLVIKRKNELGLT